MPMAVGENRKEAVKWYRKAAEQGDADAQHNLGSMYKNGRGVSRDLVEAYASYSVAAANGSVVSAEKRDELEDELSRAQLNKAQQRGAEIFERNTIPDKASSLKRSSDVKNSATNSFYQYWTKEMLNDNQSIRSGDDPILQHTAGNRLLRLGIASGDFIYIWSYFDGGLHLASRLCVDVITDDPSEIFDDLTDLYEASDHVLATEAAPMFFDLKIPNNILKKLKFINGTGELTGVKYLANGKIEPQTFRGCRQIPTDTAAVLDQLFEEKKEN